MEEAPLLWILLLIRQKAFNQSKQPGFSLLEQEQLDRDKALPWEKQVELSRARLLHK